MPIASICCWPPERVPPIWRCRSRRIGNSRRPRSNRFCISSRWRISNPPNSRFCSTVSDRKMPWPCGDHGQPVGDVQRWDAAGDDPAIEPHLSPRAAGRGRTRCATASSCRRHCGPRIVTISARSATRVDATDHGLLAVAGDEPGDREDRRHRKYRRTRSGSRINSSGWPCASARPSSR